MQLILYSKPGCHLCEGLQEKLEQIRRDVSPERLDFELEVRDITSHEDWFQAYQYEVPVLCRDNAGREEPLPRPSPRTSVQQLERMLQKYLLADEAK
jgi:glutaredoxin